MATAKRKGRKEGEKATLPPSEAAGSGSPLDRFFGLAGAGSSVATELRAGIATFLTMAYIMFVNPAILERAGMDHGAVFVATCLAAALGSLIMGLMPTTRSRSRLAWGSTSISPSPWCPSLAATGSFACTNRICSQPVFDPAELGGTVTQMLAATGSKGYSLFQ